MGWFGTWFGGSAATQAAVVAVRRVRTPLDRVLQVLQAEFHRDPDGIRVYSGISQSGATAVTVVKVDGERDAATQQVIRVTVQVISQSANVNELDRVHRRAVNALLDSDMVKIITRVEGADWFEEGVGKKGVYRRPTTMEVRA